MARWTNWKTMHVVDPKERLGSTRRFLSSIFLNFSLDHMQERAQVIIISKNFPSDSDDRPFINPQHILIDQGSNFRVDRSIFLKSFPLQFTQIKISHLNLHRILVTMSFSLPSINSPHCSSLSPFSPRACNLPLSLFPYLFIHSLYPMVLFVSVLVHF